MPKTSPAKLGEPKAINIEEAEVEKTKILEVISPSAEVTVPKAHKDLTATPKRKKDGQCTRCAGDNKVFKHHSEENCRSVKNAY
jgi:hypothetical protein